MTEAGHRVIELPEYRAVDLPAAGLSDDEANDLWKVYRAQVAVEWPSPKTGGAWRLECLGWVGYIPLTPQLGLSLQPKLPLGNVFGMFEYAYNLKSFKFLSGLVGLKSLEEFYESLAATLARKVLDRTRKGLYRHYVSEEDDLLSLRGTLDLDRRLRRPWDVRLPCAYQEHTSDVAENQLLAWTLSRIAASGLCSERTLPFVRRARHGLQGAASPVPFAAAACAGRHYNRLNEDYEPMHALCRFFLENAGPTHVVGDRKMLPFMVNMGRLFELFVGEWLKAHLPSGLELRYQEQVAVGTANELQFKIDMVVYDRESGLPRFVLDAKYKGDTTPGNPDVYQVTSYAVVKNCTDAVLVYAAPISGSYEMGDVRVRCLAFDVAGDLEEAGQAFLGALLSRG